MSFIPPNVCPPCQQLGGYAVTGPPPEAGDAAAAAAGAAGSEPLPCHPPETEVTGLMTDPNAAPAVGAPCYMPQPEDLIAPAQRAAAEGRTEEMGPIGPWATGRVDWGPLAGLTGTRPVVDKYSITRYSEGEWRHRNKHFFDIADGEAHRASLVEWNSKQCLDQTRQEVDKAQAENTKRLQQRALEVHRWKCELERAIAAAAEEIGFLEEQRHRLKRAGSVLTMPESIAGECINRRTSRMEPELVRDDVEEELIKELALTSEIRELFERTLQDIELQMIENKAAKQRLEYDWSDKKEAHQIEALNVGLNNRSNIIMWKPGATRFPNDQSTPEYWEHFTRETLKQAEATRQKSVALRSTLDDILNNAARDLRSQSDRVEAALSKKVSCTEEIRQRLENELRRVLDTLSSNERLIEKLKTALHDFDTAMKVAQTRLDNRLRRPRVESVRDVPQFGLVDEVKLIGEKVAAIAAQLKQAEDLQAGLQASRGELEREIMIKLKTLEIDRGRLRAIRDHYPSATALSGN